ncbi:MULTISPECIES: hypothetical protein [Providencia]|uniref:hypothetical protein n=1 Tax=Providencia TaxID=586 RepID=UPI001F61D543|nr:MULTISPECIES: hypothetical protein [Providencia]MCY0803448.1 hypothetical protein [Providencia rettgeri]
MSTDAGIEDLSNIEVTGKESDAATSMPEVKIDIDSPVDVPPASISENRKNTKNEDTRVLLERELIANHKADRALREKFGDKAYNVVKKTLYGWAVVLIATAFCKVFFNVELFTDTVLIAITSAVTLNTFAAFLGVIRGLFPSNRGDNGDIYRDLKKQ